MLFIPLMAFLSRLCGAGWTPKWVPSELLWSAVIAGVVSSTPSQFIIYLVWGYIAMQIGHGRFYEMKGANLADQKLESMESYIQKIYKGDITKPLYSWVCMGAKGFLMALPLGIVAAVANALLWPVSYYIGFRKLGNGAYSEIIAGLGVGPLIWVSL